jgi:peptidoglycan hydrolase CwlO-like protein
MDPDVSKKVKDLLGLVEGISSEIDIKAELETITAQILELENKLEDLAGRFDRLEQAYLEKQEIIRTIKKDLKNLFPADK